MVRLLIAFLLVASVSCPLTVVAQAEKESRKGSLGKELEGIEPGPRIAYLEYLLKTRPNDPEVYFQLAVAFQEDSKPDSALFFYTKATEIDPSLSKAYVNMGVILDDLRKPDEAIAMFEKAAALNPNDVLAHAHAAYMLFDAGDYERAWAHLSKALAVDSLNPQPHFYLAIFFWESGMYREALAEWETVVRVAPGSPLAGKAEENITILQQALTGSTDRSSVKIER